MLLRDGPHRVVPRAGSLGGGQGHREQVGLSGEDVVINVQRQLALLREQQVQVLKHLRQEERIHPGIKTRKALHLTVMLQTIQETTSTMSMNCK